MGHRLDRCCFFMSKDVFPLQNASHVIQQPETLESVQELKAPSKKVLARPKGSNRPPCPVEVPRHIHAETVAGGSGIAGSDASPPGHYQAGN